MPIKVLSGLRKIRQVETIDEIKRKHKQSNQNEHKMKLDEARKQVIQTLSDANEVRYFYTLNKENEQHIGFIMLDKAISKAILSDRDDYNELQENEKQLAKSIQQVNVYLCRRYLQNKTEQATEIIHELLKNNSPIDQTISDVQNALTHANECIGNYLSTSCEIRHAFDQLDKALHVLETNLQSV